MLPASFNDFDAIAPFFPPLRREWQFNIPARVHTLPLFVMKETFVTLVPATASRARCTSACPWNCNNTGSIRRGVFGVCVMVSLSVWLCPTLGRFVVPCQRLFSVIRVLRCVGYSLRVVLFVARLSIRPADVSRRVVLHFFLVSGILYQMFSWSLFLFGCTHIRAIRLISSRCFVTIFYSTMYKISTIPVVINHPAIIQPLELQSRIHRSLRRLLPSSLQLRRFRRGV